MFKIVAKCENGHRMEMQSTGETRAWAERLAGLMDGTSDLYLNPPGAESAIGKCGICRAAIKCTVEEAQ